MVSDRQVKGLRKMISEGKDLNKASIRSDMSENTARKYLELDRLPSETGKPRRYRTRKDPFEEVWEEIEGFLEVDESLEAKTIFEYLQESYGADRFKPGQLRTLQRRILSWKAEKGKSREAYFPQLHRPGELCQSDYTDMTSLNITINGTPFPHLLYHFVLTHSNWQSVDICFSESFESLCEGFQNALFRLGGVPRRHRTDGLSAAVNNLTEKRDFTRKYQGLLNHYGIKGEKTNPSSPHENGDVEQSNHRLKRAIEQRLMLRGNRGFSSRGEYRSFLQGIVKGLNKNAGHRVEKEHENMCSLPARRIESSTRYDNVPVTRFSTLRILHNVYSVHSRLIGKKVRVYAFHEHLEVWHGMKCLHKLPRLRGSERHVINYRHIIDSLVRKPGAFRDYKYRSDLFPSTHFRIIYDILLSQRPSKADSLYLKILYYAAYNNEDLVDRALKMIIDEELDVDIELIKKITSELGESDLYKDPEVSPADLSDYDALITEGGEL